ncbi:hypothetical protein CC86DRAFT_96805 [Ophiobolus disseminans]|uniref:Uncharacterized protein n=1 Tax=Ophiobolus disseminans TaxID=1469910 RepID=A0A6A6ZN23_9PLEO|nr:hypothetical protein CC86DRAFT_96805 [Ophiobolus disseminans]
MSLARVAHKPPVLFYIRRTTTVSPTHVRLRRVVYNLYYHLISSLLTLTVAIEKFKTAMRRLPCSKTRTRTRTRYPKAPELWLCKTTNSKCSWLPLSAVSGKDNTPR